MTVVIDPLTSVDLADEEAFNSRFGALVSKINTGFDSTGLLDGAVTRAKIGQGAVTQAKMDNTFTWTTIPYGTGWAAWTDATFGDPQYYKDARGTVRFRGLVRRVSGSGTTIATMPVGFRPDKRLIFIAVSNNTTCRIDIDTSGNIVWVTGPDAASWHSLANIHYRAVQ